MKQFAGLRAVLDAAMTDGQKMKDLTVLAPQNGDTTAESCEAVFGPVFFPGDRQ